MSSFKVYFNADLTIGQGTYKVVILEVLQVVSDPISCTQLPGTPEITKMSLSTCSPSGGEELWMIGKNFLKDCVVVFQESSCSRRLPDRCDIVI